MRQRCLTSLGALVVGVFVVSLAPAPATAQTTEGWTVPRTPDGHPDLQGVWANNSATPLERPEGFEEKPLLSEEELATVRERAAQLASSSSEREFENRTSLIVDAFAKNSNRRQPPPRDSDRRESLPPDLPAHRR